MEKCKKYYNILIVDDVHGITNNNPTNRMRLIPNNLDCNQELYSRTLKEICCNAYKIILHSAFWGNETKKLVYALTQFCAPKMVWGCFGGDAYFDKDSFEVKEIISKVGICSVTAGTYNIVKENYGIDGEIDSNAYYVYIPQSLLKKCSIHCTHDTVNILLGHNAFDHGNHIEGMEILKKYDKENIKLFCPLSYGSEQYRDKVVQKGKELFGDKFIPVLSYMNLEHYFQFLQTIDVAVFPLKRLAAESTLLLLKAAGVKIYADIDVMEYMQDTLVHMENITKIQNESFDEFATHQQKELCDADDVNKFIASKWANFFDD